MKKLFPLFLVCASASVIAILAFINNCFVVYRWWDVFLTTGGDTAAMSKESIDGFISWLNWSAVDYSAVTTFIPMLGLLFMTFSVVRLMRKGRVNADDFPFFKGSDQLYVALGLFGTLWGIIVIGFYQLETVAMADLMHCLHTALFSTLMAVVWVFMFDRPLIRPFFMKLAYNAGLVETDSGDLADSVDRFIVRLGKASDEFEARQMAFEQNFRDRQNIFEKETKKMFTTFVDAVSQQLAKVEAASNDRQKLVDEALAKRQKEQSEIFVKQQKDQGAAFAKSLADLDESCQKRTAAYEKEFEARQKEYVEFFRRRLDELQNEVAQARAHADETQKRLTAVTQALNN